MRVPKVKRIHEFRDPIHNFISLDRQARSLVDSVPFQRLRQIHQLALTYNVYPGASHKRFEHSLGVMHLAGQVFDIVTDPRNRHPATDYMFPDNLQQSRVTLCLAALCHDLGHLPFSHAAEKELLPKGQDHESLTLAVIESSYLHDVWASDTNVNKDMVKKLAVGSKKLKGVNFTSWEAILAEIITGDSFGVDRIDYLLRDSYHCGVTYGRFDHNRLIQSLRILPKSEGEDEDESNEPTLGIDLGGLNSAEALLLARYFMYKQMYFHHVRRAYDFHLIQYMKAFYAPAGYSMHVDFHMSQTDNEVLAGLRLAARDPEAVGHHAATAVLDRKHFKKVYERVPSDDNAVQQAIIDGLLRPEKNQSDLTAANFIFKAMKDHFPHDKLHYDAYDSSANPAQFPVLMSNGRIEQSTRVSDVLEKLPLMNIRYILVDPTIKDQVEAWMDKNVSKIVTGAAK